MRLLPSDHKDHFLRLLYLQEPSSGITTEYSIITSDYLLFLSWEGSEANPRNTKGPQMVSLVSNKRGFLWKHQEEALLRLGQNCIRQPSKSTRAGP